MAGALALGVWSSPQAEARDSASRHIDVNAGTLGDAIAELAREERISIGTEGPLPRVNTPRVKGTMPVGEALARLLGGTGYRARQVGDTAWRIERAPIAPAQPAAPSAPPPPAPPVVIVVTATKQPLDLHTVPATVSVVELANAQRHDTASASAAVSSQIEGLALTSLGAGRNRMFLHGVADSAFSGESQSTVAVVLDEARITYSAPDPDIRLVDMDRVEVLKGPQGSLYGTGALGGIYHLVTHQAELDGASLTVSTGASVVAHGAPGYSGSAVANLPLSAGTAGLRLVGYSALEPGWIDTGKRENTNSNRVTGGRASLGLVPAQGWRLDLTGFGQWLEARDTSYVYTAGSLSRPAQIAEPHDNDLRHLAARLKGGFGAVDMLLSSAMTWHDVTDNLDATAGAGSFGLDDPQTLEDKREFRVWDNDLRLRGQLGSLSWLAGLSRLESRQSMIITLRGLSGAQVTADNDKRISHDSAAYFDLALPVTSTLSVNAGARLFLSSIRETRVLTSGPVTREIDKSGITPALALAWQPNPDRLIYMRYGSAFRQGGTDISATGSVDVLKGDELASLEAGWREKLPGGIGHAELNAWYTRWEDVQTDSLEDNGLIETISAGDARIIGIEGNVDFRLGNGWRAEAGANFTDARLTRNALGYRLEENRLPVVPEYTLRGALQHDFALGDLAASVRLNMRYIGPARMSFDPDLDRKMGDLVESRLEMHLSRSRWDLGLTLQNLFNDKGNVFAFGNALRYQTMHQYTPQRPTSLSLNATLQL